MTLQLVKNGEPVPPAQEWVVIPHPLLTMEVKLMGFMGEPIYGRIWGITGYPLHITTYDVRLANGEIVTVDARRVYYV